MAVDCFDTERVFDQFTTEVTHDAETRSVEQSQI